MKKHVLEGLTLVALAVVCALASNALASRERKMALAGYYPSATKVPAQTAEPSPIGTPTPPATQPRALANAPEPAVPQPVTQSVAQPTPQPRNPVTPQPTSARPTPTKPIEATYKPHPDKKYIEIPYADVKTLHDAGVLFLDARRTSIYEQGHIAGARPFSVWESDIDEKVRKLWEERQDPAQQALAIVIYCSGGECEDSHMLAEKLWGATFTNVYVYKDGYPDWVAHHGATNR